MTQPETQIQTKLKNIVQRAYTDTITNYWHEERPGGYFKDPYKEGRSTLSDLPWIYVMGLLSMESYYFATGDASYLSYLAKQRDTYFNMSKDWLLATGKGANPAVDDAAWSAMGYMLFYKYLGDQKALSYCHEMIRNAYDYWQDGDTGNGLWYSYPEDNNGHVQVKTIYCVGLILTELEYYEATKGDPQLRDEELHSRTMALYNWIEENMCRNEVKTWNGEAYPYVDNLYFCSFVDNKQTGEYYPDRYDHGNTITQAKSWTSLFGNTGMCVVNKRLYDMTGEKTYLDKAVATANALVTTAYNNNGILLNDRDAWTNCAFMGDFAREVLMLPGIDPEIGRILLHTASAIMTNSYYEGGFYGSDWDGSGIWLKNDKKGEHTAWFATNATSTHILYTAYEMVKQGVVAMKETDLELFPDVWPVRKIDEAGNVIQ